MPATKTTATKAKAKTKATTKATTTPGGTGKRVTKPKPKAKATPKKKAAATKAKAKAPAEAVTGTERHHDLPWCDKKVALFKALKKNRAVGVDNALTSKQLADAAEVSARDVRHYCYSAACPEAGLIGLEKVEGQRGYGFYLTAKGAAIDPVKALKEQEAAKKS